MSEEKAASDFVSRHVIAVLGAGSFGTVTASLMAANGHDVRLYVRDVAQAQEMARARENGRYLPGMSLPAGLQISSDLAAVLAGADTVFMAVPSKAFRQLAATIAPMLAQDTVLVSLTKGIEAGTFSLMSQILHEECGDHCRVGVVSGPNLAREIAQGQPSGTVAASPDECVRERIHQILSSSRFRVFLSSDMYGVELGGALKNIYAIASGMAAALNVGENTRAMLLTRALAEMSRFAVQQGANPLTFLGLAGVGDLIATCSSALSRNYQVGYALGQGQSLQDIIEDLEQTAEGINTLAQVKARADALGVEMPIAEGLHAIVFDRRTVLDVVQALMGRAQSSDVEFVLPR